MYLAVLIALVCIETIIFCATYHFFFVLKDFSSGAGENIMVNTVFENFLSSCVSFKSYVPGDVFVKGRLDQLLCPSNVFQ